jgi:hypothetical protein
MTRRALPPGRRVDRANPWFTDRHGTPVASIKGPRTNLRPPIRLITQGNAPVSSLLSQLRRPRPMLRVIHLAWAAILIAAPSAVVDVFGGPVDATSVTAARILGARHATQGPPTPHPPGVGGGTRNSAPCPIVLDRWSNHLERGSSTGGPNGTMSGYNRASGESRGWTGRGAGALGYGPRSPEHR